MKKALKSIIRRGVRWLDPFFGIDDYENHTFYAPIVAPGSVVLDLGSCLGDFAHYMSSRYGCICHAVEPSPALFENISAGPGVVKHNLAVGGGDGTASFYLSEKIEAGNIRRHKPNTIGMVSVQTRSLDSFLRDVSAQEVALAKVDIEGAEIDMFKAATPTALKKCSQINVEFHDQIRHPTSSAAEVAEARRTLEAAGFVGFDLGRKGFNWLFINRSSPVPVTALIYLWVRSRFRNVMGESVSRSAV